MEIALSLVGVDVTLLAGVVGYMVWRTGKIIKENATATLQKMDEGLEEWMKDLDL
ncbi:MAG: hypothetical protein ABDH37_06670 [Candidatus Hydrothermales bacterium]